MLNNVNYGGIASSRALLIDNDVPRPSAHMYTVFYTEEACAEHEKHAESGGYLGDITGIQLSQHRHGE